MGKNEQEKYQIAFNKNIKQAINLSGNEWGIKDKNYYCEKFYQPKQKINWLGFSIWTLAFFIVIISCYFIFN